MSPKVKVEDASHDRKYFILTPQLVWALCRNPHDYSLWNVIKMIAGENGECTLDTGDLASLAMMSRGQAHNSRKYLLEIGLLEGEKIRDPGYPTQVWHLRIPDLWPRNLRWRQELGDKLRDRIRWKIEQRERVHPMNALEKARSPHEPGRSPHEPSRSQGEQKENHKGEPKEEQEQPDLFSYVTDDGVEVQI